MDYEFNDNASDHEGVLEYMMNSPGYFSNELTNNSIEFDEVANCINRLENGKIPVVYLIPNIFLENTM